MFTDNKRNQSSFLKFFGMKGNRSVSFQKSSLEERKASEKKHVAKRGWCQSYTVIQSPAILDVTLLCIV